MRHLRRAIISLGIASAAVFFGAAHASATPPVVTPQPGGVIRIDLPPGEGWYCAGNSFSAPFLNVTPPVIGPKTWYMGFFPGADVFLGCEGFAAPFLPAWLVHTQPPTPPGMVAPNSGPLPSISG